MPRALSIRADTAKLETYYTSVRTYVKNRQPQYSITIFEMDFLTNLKLTTPAC